MAAVQLTLEASAVKYDDDPWASTLRDWADSRLYTVTYGDCVQFDPLPVAFARVLRYLMRVVPLSANGRQYCAEIVLALERNTGGVEMGIRSYDPRMDPEVSFWNMHWNTQLAFSLYVHVHQSNAGRRSSSFSSSFDKRQQRKFLFEDIADVLVQQHLSEDGDPATKFVVDLMLGNIE